MNHLGEQVEIELAKKKISNSDFAKELGITVQQLYTIFRGKSHSTVKTLKEISQILDVPSDVFLQDYDKEFLIYAIDDYLNRMDKERACEVLKNCGLLLHLGEEKPNG